MTERIRVALVIGNSAYGSASILKNPSNDARDIASAFTRIGFSGVSTDHSFAGPGAVVPMFDLDHRQLREAIAAFARAADGAEQAVMYYAGHGIEVGGQNYLVPVDANLRAVTDVGLKTVSLSELLNALDNSTGLKLVILDACRDNPFRNLFVRTRGLSRGLNRIEPPSRDILVAYAAKHGTVALDGDGRNSPFATALLEHVEKPGLEVRNFFGEIRDSVLEITENQQEPFLYGTLGRKQEYLVPVVGREDDVIAHNLWNQIKDSDDPSDHEGFLVEFPKSQFALSAKRISEKLINAANDVDVLNRFKENHPSSPRIALVDRQIAILSASQCQTDEANERLRGTNRGKQNAAIHFPSYELLVGIVAGVVSGATYHIPLLSLDFSNGLSTSGYAQIHTGIIFGLAILICLHHLGLKRGPKFIGLVMSALVLWVVYANVALFIVVSMAFGETWIISLIKMFSIGLVTAALLSVSTQWLCDQLVEFRPIVVTALIGGVASLVLALDVKIDPTGVPWLTFLIWEPTVLTSLSLTMRDRIAKLRSQET
jgi:hypothetical protein